MEKNWKIVCVTKKYLPFGITPGSINVASVKLAMTKNVMTPWYAGTHGYRNM